LQPNTSTLNLFESKNMNYDELVTPMSDGETSQDQAIKTMK